MRSVLVVLLLPAAACGAPITCPAHETARKELLCPACSPDDPCECHEGWVCRETPEAAEQRRQQNARAAEERQRRSAEQQERQREQARLLDAQRAAAEQALLERQAREEQARREEQERLQSAYPAPLDAPPGCEAPCPRGQIRWTRFSCGTPERPHAFFDNRPCPAGLPAGTRGCASPWRLESECVPDPDAPPARAARCLAPPGRCCLPDGRIVRPCGPIGRPGCNENTSLCGSGGFCNACRCLPPDAPVLTAAGPRPIRDLRAGDAVVSRTADGRRVLATVVRVSSQAVVTAHTLFVVRLADGRVVRGSAPHPLADGRLLGALTPGDRVDGSRVVTIEQATFDGEALWDIAVDGETGVYYVDSVPLRSTLPPGGW